MLIIDEINQIIGNYDNQSIDILSGLPFHQAATIKMIEFYSNSRYLKGQLDELGKEKPFYNIGNSICDVEDAAVDIDTKDITATADLPQDYDKSFMLSIELFEWMKEANFGFTLNEMRSTRTRYGGVLVKKVIETVKGKRELKIETPEWKNLVTDPIDLINGVIIEKHYMSPSELLKKADVWDNVEEAVKLASKTRVGASQRGGSDGTGTNRTASNKKIPIFEVRGEFPLSFYKDSLEQRYVEADKNKYSYDYYVIAGEQGGKQFKLYCEQDTERIYKYLPRKRKAGRAFGMGVIEENEEAQVWTNDVVLKQKKALEYTSKVLGQSASHKLKGRNMITEYEDGSILEHDDGKPITALSLLPAGGMQQFENLIAQWQQLTDRTSSTYAAQRGETPPSGTPYRTTATILQQSSSVFDDLREEFGIFVGEIFYDWVLPFISARLNKKHILSHEFEADELKSLDEAYSTHTANQKVKEKILSGELVSQEQYEAYKEFSLGEVRKSKGRRFFDIPKDYYKDLEMKITINTTGEQRNKAAILESLTNVLTTAAANPAILQDPVASQIFMKIVELSGAGISPVSLASAIQEQAKMMQEQQEQQMQMAQQTGQVPGAKPAAKKQPALSLEANPAR